MDDWVDYVIKKKYGPYKTCIEARQKSNRVVDGRSGNSMDDSDAPRKRKQPMKFTDFVATKAKRASNPIESDQQIESVPFPPPLPNMHQKPHLGSSNQNVDSNSTPVATSSKDSSTTKSFAPPSESNFEKLLSTMRGKVDSSAKKGKTLKLPVECLDELKTLETKVASDPDVYTELVNMFEWLLDTDIRQSTFKMLRKLMDDVVAQNLNWKGKGKIPFRSFELCTMIVETVNFRFGKVNGNVTVIEQAVKDWLKAAPTRLKSHSKQPKENLGAERIDMATRSDCHSGSESD
ncbi:unnamed protein product [Allacma fusca]|uniref:DUF4806 domain-containing protein n=1 Tax=Allacma fusca TaxID=39272 RepID=A0A8J2NYM8_9HEXA|nr:unnamed protein product [Allacma fusca]